MLLLLPAKKPNRQLFLPGTSCLSLRFSRIWGKCAARWLSQAGVSQACSCWLLSTLCCVLLETAGKRPACQQSLIQSMPAFSTHAEKRFPLQESLSLLNSDSFLSPGFLSRNISSVLALKRTPFFWFSIPFCNVPSISPRQSTRWMRQTLGKRLWKSKKWGNQRQGSGNFLPAAEVFLLLYNTTQRMAREGTAAHYPSKTKRSIWAVSSGLLKLDI